MKRLDHLVQVLGAFALLPIGILIVVAAIIVGFFRSCVMRKAVGPLRHVKRPELVEDDPDHIDPLGDLIGILS